MKRVIKLTKKIQLIHKNSRAETNFLLSQNKFIGKCLIILFLIPTFFLGFVAAQNTDDDELINIETLLVNVPVIVSDREGRYISGLKKENFFVIENGERRNVDFFASDEAPMNVAILIDASPSIRNVLDEVKIAAFDFIKTLRPEDKCLIASFDANINILNDFISDQKKLNKSIERINLGGRAGSNMQDAMYQLVTDNFAAIKGRKAIIVLTDGAVRGGNISNKKLLDTLIESDVIVYPILFDAFTDYLKAFKFEKYHKLPNGEVITGEEMRKRIYAAEEVRLTFMKSLGVLTGGRFYKSENNDFKKTFQNIADELKKQYVVGFYPLSIPDGKPRKIAIEVDSKNVVVRTKTVIRPKTNK